MRIAAVDIGTNTLLMTIAQLHSDGHLEILSDHHSIVRLGAGLQDGAEISPEAYDRALRCLQDYSSICNDFSVDVRVGVATSAARRASNGAAVIQSLQKSFSASFQIVDGAEEARLTFLGTAAAGQLTTVIDIGGGSTEIVCGRDADIQFRRSLEIGAVRLTEAFFKHLPASTDSLSNAIAELRFQLANLPPIPIDSVLIGVAGTPTTLAAVAQGVSEISAERVDNYELTNVLLDEFVEQFMGQTVDQIRHIPGVHAQRADILPAGTLILRELMSVVGRDSLRVSTRGLRFGVLRGAAESLSRRALARR